MVLVKWLFEIPLIAALVTLGLPMTSPKLLHRLVVLLSLLPLALLLYGHESWVGANYHYDWLPQLSIPFHLSIDAVSLVFLYLIAILVPISLLAVRPGTLRSPPLFYALVLALEGLLIGFFTAHDLALFTIFWEAMLLPLYFIITLWGGADRKAAALKFLLYMIAGSTLMIAGVLFLYFATGAHTFDLAHLAQTAEKTPYSHWVLGVFLLAFAVKTPLFPFHAWLPDTYYQAPTAGSILLAGLLSKAGIYGVWRIGLGLFPRLMQMWSPILLALAIAGVLYGALAAWSQRDYKRLIAYSSFSHVNFILAGLFVWNETAHQGAILQTFNHGIIIAGLFLVASWLEDRLATTSMDTVGGLAKPLPQLCWLTLVFVIASVAAPGTGGFVGELLILFGVFGQNPWLAAVLGLSVILSVVYMLHWMQSIYFGPLRAITPSWHDIRATEFAIAMPLVALILWVGIYPSPLLRPLQSAMTKSSAVLNPNESP